MLVVCAHTIINETIGLFFHFVSFCFKCDQSFAIALFLKGEKERRRREGKKGRRRGAPHLAGYPGKEN
jgi:hypothetical protein